MRKSIKFAAVMALAALTAATAVKVNASTLILTGGTMEAYLQPQQLTEAFPNVGADDGTISSWVVNDPADPSGYTYIYQVVNNGVDAISHVELTGFNSSDVLASDGVTGIYSGVMGLSLIGSSTPSVNGYFSSFSLTGSSAANFLGASLPNGGAASFFMVIATNQKNIGNSYGQMQDDFTAVGTILAPVPEPGSSLVLLTGFICLFGILKYRKVALNR